MGVLSGSLVLMTWSQFLVGGGGIAFVVVGVIFGIVTFGHVQWDREPPLAVAYVALSVVGLIASGVCFIVAASLRSHFWELAGSITIVASYAARMVLARLVGRRYPDKD
jgi:hypothetical protein